MTIQRFDFQRECVLKTSGKILNVGAKEDPAHLKRLRPDAVNLDRWNYDIAAFFDKGELVPIDVDVIHDATVLPWPFADNEFGLVVLGDILEDLPDNECQLEILKEARRVAEAVCITTPEDTFARDNHHYTTITETRLRNWLQKADWEPVDFRVVNYEVVPRGYFVYAKRVV